MNSEVRFARDLADLRPEFADLSNEQTDPDGQVIPFLFVQEVADWATQAFRSGNLDDVSRVTAWLEEAFANGNRYVQDLISVAFVEALPASSEDGSGIRKLLGPNLASEYGRLKW
jgi:hypothetical protein